MEIVFHISNCTVENQIKFATCTLLESALMWWNSHVRTVGHDVAYAMTWTSLKKMMTDRYCPRGEIKKLEVEMWNLKVKGTDVVSHNQRFQELALMCARMFPKELDKIERYVDGLPDMIHGSVMTSKPKTMQDTIEFATELMDKKIRTFTERHSENKRKQDDNQQKQQNKRQNTGMAYAAGSGEKKPYGGSKPLCSKCNYLHDGQCAPKCHKCNRVGHLACDCRSTENANTANNQRGTRAGQKPTCFECGAQGHFNRECPKLKNNNRGNQVGNGNALAKSICGRPCRDTPRLKRHYGNSDDIQAAGSDTRPPMLDRTDYESWSQRIRLYCTTLEGGVLLGPERARTYDDLNDNEKKRFDTDVRATNIVLQRLPKDIYKIINHNIEAKAIWDNVKMLLAGSELTK
ncbi:reverse transcriptase domain-containing protein [Tanacetum coccineum]